MVTAWMGHSPTSTELGDPAVWVLGGLLHRTDGPAVQYADGGVEWWWRGRLHRDDGPAVTTADGQMRWYETGLLHRTDGPAVISAAGDEEWYRYGRRHRVGGPALTHVSGRREHWVDGRFAHTAQAYRDLVALWHAEQAEHEHCVGCLVCHGAPAPTARGPVTVEAGRAWAA